MFSVMLLALLAGCRSESSSMTIVVLDSTSARDTLEVIALPIDPATLAALPALPRDDEAQRAIALRDSATALDERFQLLRDTLNETSRSMHDADRHSSAYHQRFDAWRLRLLAADSLRLARDRMRARVARTGSSAVSAKSTVRANLVAAISPDGRRAILRKVAGGDSVMLDLARGEWWIGIASIGQAPARWNRAAAGRMRLRP